MASAMQGITYEDRLNLPLDKIIERNRDKTKKAQKKARNNAFNANRQIGEKKNKGEKKPKGEKKKKNKPADSSNSNNNTNGGTPGKKKFKRPSKGSTATSTTSRTTFRRRPRPTAPVSRAKPNGKNTTKSNINKKQPRIDLNNPPSITISIVNDLAFERKPKPPAAHRASIRSIPSFPSHRGGGEIAETFAGQSNSTTLSQRFSRF